MKLDLSALNYKDRIDISGKVSYDAKFLENSPIKKLDDVNYSGFITRNDIDEYFINIRIYGTMVLLDSVSLEELDYPYDINIDDEITDFIEKNQNALDINEFLWQNIVLEVPIRYTLCDAEKLKGDNWCVLSSNEGGE
ncbi:putative ACR COG1399 [Mycoplasma sp. CAG:472]|nr:putative ACR COG1399 [Mycoplasma sp. CAG:472]